MAGLAKGECVTLTELALRQDLRAFSAPDENLSVPTPDIHQGFVLVFHGERKSCVERICMTLDKIPVDIWDCLS